MPEGEILTGAEAVHRVFRRWLAETEAPETPLSPPAGGPGERVG